MKKLLSAVMLAALLSACAATTGARPSPSTALTPTSPSASPSTSPSHSPSPSPVPSPTAPQGFACTNAGGGAVAASTVTTARIGQHPGYDRLVIEFGGGVPTYTVTVQPSTTFTRSPKGDRVTLEGSSGVLVIVHSITNWASYSGPTAFTPRYPYLRQALLVENFEGYQQWALGIEGAACVRVGTMGSPSRLVIDVGT